MLLSSLLIAVILERLFKYNDLWHFDKWIKNIFLYIKNPSLFQILFIIFSIFICTFIFSNLLLNNINCNILTLIIYTFIILSCIGCGSFRKDYQKYLKFISKKNIYEEISKLQNNIIWINFRFYFVPIFWYIIGGKYFNISFLLIYSFLRSWNDFLNENNLLKLKFSKVNILIDMIEWIPARLIGITYIIFSLKYNIKLIKFWIRSLFNINCNQYYILLSFTNDICKKYRSSYNFIYALQSTLIISKLSTLLTLILEILIIYNKNIY